MPTHRLFALYANTPLAKRGVMIDFIKYGTLTLNNIYVQVKALEDKMRPDRIAEEKLLSIAATVLHD